MSETPIPRQQGELDPSMVQVVRNLYEVPAFQALLTAVRERIPGHPTPDMDSHVVAQQSMIRQGYERAVLEFVSIGYQQVTLDDDPYKNLLNTKD
jgi:hypothetical protein